MILQLAPSVNFISFLSFLILSTLPYVQLELVQTFQDNDTMLMTDESLLLFSDSSTGVTTDNVRLSSVRIK